MIEEETEIEIIVEKIKKIKIENKKRIENKKDKEVDDLFMINIIIQILKKINK